MSFDVPPLAPGAYNGFLQFSADMGEDVESRVCCALNNNRGVEPKAIGTDGFRRHAYRRKPPGPGGSQHGGGLGYVYTRRGGLVDLGHLRDFADYTLYFANKYFHHSRAGLTDATPGPERPASSVGVGGEGDIRLIIAAQPSGDSDPIDKRLCIIAGARLAYQRALWHEIFTYGTATEDFSSFSPEDNFSNALGALVGARALATPNVEYRTAVDAEITRVLTSLGAESKDVTDDAIDYVDGHWFSPGLMVF